MGVAEEWSCPPIGMTPGFSNMHDAVHPLSSWNVKASLLVNNWYSIHCCVSVIAFANSNQGFEPLVAFFTVLMPSNKKRRTAFSLYSSVNSDIRLPFFFLILESAALPLDGNNSLPCAMLLCLMCTGMLWRLECVYDTVVTSVSVNSCLLWHFKLPYQA